MCNFDLGNKASGESMSKNALHLMDKLKDIDLIVDDTDDNISSKIKKFNLLECLIKLFLEAKLLMILNLEKLVKSQNY